MTPFDRLVAAADRAVTSAMGTRAELLPRVQVRLAAPAPDPSRTAAIVRGVFTDQPADAALQGQRQGGEMAGVTVIAGAKRLFWLSVAALDELGWRPRQGDALRLVDRSGEPVYGIERADPSDHGDMTLTLSLERQP